MHTAPVKTLFPLSITGSQSTLVLASLAPLDLPRSLQEGDPVDQGVSGPGLRGQAGGGQSRDLGLIWYMCQESVKMILEFFNTYVSEVSYVFRQSVKKTGTRTLEACISHVLNSHWSC